MTDAKWSKEFTLGGTKFRGRALEPDVSLDVFAIVGPGFADVIKAIDVAKLREEANAIDVAIEGVAAGLRSFGALRQVAPHFAKAYEVVHGGSFLSVDLFRSEVFAGKPALQIAWLVGAVVSEYRDFLAPAGLNTFTDLAAIFGYQITSKSTGPSGG